MRKHDSRPKQTERWEVAATSLIGPPKRISVESQLNAMFGGELLREKTGFIPVAKLQRIRPPHAIASAVVPMIVASVLIGLIALGFASQSLRRSRERVVVIHDLSGFLRSGALR